MEVVGKDDLINVLNEIQSSDLDVRGSYLEKLKDLSCDDTVCMELVEVGVIKKVLKVMSCGDSNSDIVCLKILSNLSHIDSLSPYLIDCETIYAMAPFLDNSLDEIRCLSSSILGYISLDSSCEVYFSSRMDIWDSLKRLTKDYIGEIRGNCYAIFANLLSSFKHQEMWVNLGIISLLVIGLDDSELTSRRNSISALGYLAWNSHHNLVIESGALHKVIALVSSDDDILIVRNSVMFLANLASHEDNHQIMMSLGSDEVCSGLFNNPNVDDYHTILSCLRCLISLFASYKTSDVMKSCIERALHLLHNEDCCIRVEAIKFLSSLCISDHECREHICKYGLELLMDTLMSNWEECSDEQEEYQLHVILIVYVLSQNVEFHQYIVELLTLRKDLLSLIKTENSDTRDLIIATMMNVGRNPRHKKWVQALMKRINK